MAATQLFKPKKPSSGSSNVNRFKELAESLAALAAREKLEIVPYDDPSLPHFNALDPAAQSHVLLRLETMVAICTQLQSQGARIRNPKALVWAFFKHSKLTPPSDLQDRLDVDDIIDIYNEHHQMIFADLRFFETCTYALEELYCRPWMDLFIRDSDEVNKELFCLAHEIIFGHRTGVIDTSYMPTHKATEAYSKSDRWALIRHKLFSSLSQDGKTKAYLCAYQAEITTAPEHAAPLLTEADQEQLGGSWRPQN